MAGLGNNVFINPERAFWLREVPPDVSHSTIVVQELDASIARISTATIDDLTVSSALFSTFGVQNLDVSGMYVSSLNGNSGFFSSITFASDLSGGVGFVRFHVDASGIQVDGDPIRFDNLVYLTSTINIIQVSTLVDTDIFALRGFFSTLSSGNLFASKAFISSLEVTDLSGFSEQNWSLYPTLSGEIIFSTGYNLSNAGSNLFFAGQQLAYGTDISGIDTWSYFPAISSLKMNNQVITGLSTINFQDTATLTSQTGNNLFYNGQAIQYGATSNISQWANFPAVNTVQLSNSGINATGSIPIAATSNVSITAQRISTVADQGLLNLASFADINLTAQNGLKGRINLTANPGAAGVFGEINLTANGGTVAGVGTGGEINIIANTPIGLSNLTSAVNINAAGINSYAGAIPPIGSLAGYNFVYGTLGVSLVAGIPPSGFQVPGTTYLYGTNGVTTSSEFYVPSIFPYFNGLTTPPDLTIQGRVTNAQQVFVQLSNVKTMAMGGTAAITGANLVSAVSSIGSNAQFTTGSFGALASGSLGVTGNVALNFGTGTTQAASLSTNSISTSIVTAPLLSTININLSTINGVDWEDISGGVFTTTSTFVNLFADSIKASTLNVSSIEQFGGFPIQIQGSLRFQTPDAIDNVTIINTNSEQPPSLLINASTITIGGNNVQMNSVSTNRLQANEFLTSSFSVGSFFGSNVITSTLSAVGGLPIKMTADLQFVGGNSFIDNVDLINTNPLNVPVLAIGASTIQLNTANTFTLSLSTTNLKTTGLATSSIAFSTARYTGSNTGFYYPIIIDQDHAQSTVATAADGAGIQIRGHNFQTGAIQNVLDMGVRGNGENYIMALWPGLNLEDLYIDATEVIFRDGVFSTIINLDPYGLITTGAISAPSLLVSTINGGVPSTPTGTGTIGVPGISTVQLALSTIQMAEQSGLVSPPSSIMNLVFGYNASTGINGFYLENNLNTIDNFDFGLEGNADGAYIKSWTNARSSYSELFINANQLTLGVDSSVIIDDNATGDFTEIGPTYISTQALAVSTINDVVFPQQPIYCEFTTTSTIVVGTSNQPTVIPLDSTNVQEGINLDAGDVEILTSGTYLYNFNVQLDKTGGGIEFCDLWLRINGSDYGGTGSRVTIQGNTGQCLAVCQFILPLNANDKVALVFASPDDTMAATYFPAWITPGDPYDRPDIPAAIVIVQKIG